MSAPTPKQAAAMDLCRHCGLCCDGTLFSWVTVTPEESEPLRARGLPLVQRDDGTFALRQSCAALSGRDCTAYGDRPRPCRAFRCHQLIALEEGEIDRAEAVQLVDRTHGAIRRLARTMQRDDQIAGVVDEARRAQATGTASSETAAALVEVDTLLARHFLGRSRR